MCIRFGNGQNRDDGDRFLLYPCRIVFLYKNIKYKKDYIMIIFNTTYHVDNLVLDDFIKFLRNEFIPAATASKELSEPRLTRVLAQEPQEGSSFALQFEVEELEKLDDWYDQIGDNLNEDLVAKFGSQVVGFSTLLEVIDL